MADTKPSNNPSLRLVEHWSAISTGDLGLKAVYWTDDKRTAIRTRPIQGWITFVSRQVQDVIPVQGFAAVVVGDNWFPVIASFLPNYLCIAPTEASDDEIIQRAPEFAKKSDQGAPAPLAAN